MKKISWFITFYLLAIGLTWIYEWYQIPPSPFAKVLIAKIENEDNKFSFSTYPTVEDKDTIYIFRWYKEDIGIRKKEDKYGINEKSLLVSVRDRWHIKDALSTRKEKEVKKVIQELE